MLCMKIIEIGSIDKILLLWGKFRWAVVDCA